MSLLDCLYVLRYCALCVFFIIVYFPVDDVMNFEINLTIKNVKTNIRKKKNYLSETYFDSGTASDYDSLEIQGYELIRSCHHLIITRR